jgi:hypothetical protein
LVSGCDTHRPSHPGDWAHGRCLFISAALIALGFDLANAFDASQRTVPFVSATPMSTISTTPSSASASTAAIEHGAVYVSP